jgi:hypothetical protein
MVSPPLITHPDARSISIHLSSNGVRVSSQYLLRSAVSP